MKRLSLIIVVVFLLIAAPVVFCQEEQEEPAAQGVAPGAETEAVAEGQPIDLAEEAQDLVRQTLAGDIDTASYYELVAWCRDLGLADAGTRQTLQQRLYNYYQVSTPAPPPKDEEKKRILEIKSAKETQYFTVEEIDEDYVLLLGNVAIEIQEESATHRIKAHRVLLNQTENILTAEGGIEYTLIKGAEEEVFIGEKLTFDIRSWEGVFFSGGLEAERTIAGETIRFRFLGESISRLEKDTVVIDKGTITSCDLPENPHYHIRARKIWVTAPNEWALLHAVLYIGHVPVLYLPFFFHPGDEFFFHPAIGYRNREGNFIQTTTYLVGQKPRSTSALSFLAATEESTTQYELERRGLFLRPLSDKPIKVDENRFLKVMLDFYSRLGGFAGIEGNFPPQVDFRGGLAVSRTLYQVPGSLAYTPWKEEDGVYSSSWNRAYLFGFPLPLRFGLESSWDLGSGNYTLSGSFEYYTDPSFTSDFFNRAEDTGLTRLIGIEPLEETTEGGKQNLTWELNGQMDFSDKFDTPFVKTFSFPSIRANLFWDSKDNEDPEVDQDYDPAREFYYPDSLKLPSASFQVLGDLVDITRPSLGKKSQPEAEPVSLSEVQETLRIPDALEKVSLPEQENAVRSIEAIGLRQPQPKADTPVALEKTPLHFRLSYQVRPNILVEQKFNSKNWTEPQDVAYDLQYTGFDTSGVSSLDYSLTVLENVLALSGNLLYRGDYRTTETDWNNSVASTLGLDYYPFADDPIFGKSSLSYDVTSTFYRYTRNDALSQPGYYGSGIRWDDEWFSQHALQAALRWRMFEADSSFSLSAQLPPRQASVTGNLELNVWLLTTTVNTVFKYEGSDLGHQFQEYEDWAFGPLIAKQILRLSEDVDISEELRCDIERPNLTSSLTSLNLWGFYGSFTAERLIPKELNNLNGQWEDQGTREYFLPSYVNLGYKLTTEERYFWKKRIRTQTTVDTSWSMNIEEFTENRLDFSLTFRLFIHKFLQLSFTSRSYNNRTFQYIPGLVDQVAEYDRVNILDDLLKSFNFFDINDRRISGFKLGSITVEATHYLHDWNLILSYEGKPYVNEEAKKYQWGNTFSVVLQWLPIPEMKSTIDYKGGVPEQTSGVFLRG